MPTRLSERQREKFLGRRHPAVLVTLDAAGASIPTPIWYLHRDGVFYFRTADNAVKTQNVRRDPRVSICIQDERPPYRAVIVHGTAVVSHEQTWLADEMPRHYLGRVGALGYRAAAREHIEGGPEVTLLVRPSRITSFDFASDTPAVGRLWLLLKRILPAWI